MIVLPEDEYHTIVSSFVWTKHWNVTERRTDGQTARDYYSAVKMDDYIEGMHKNQIEKRRST